MARTIRINSNDNVIVAVEGLSKGSTVTINDVDILLEKEIPMGHKIALSNIKAGEKIVKYGFPIGSALANIKAGEHIHTHNLKTDLDENLEYKFNPTPISNLDENNDGSRPGTFQGYERKNGDVGIRNEFWIIPTVGCVNGQAKQILELLKAECDVSHLDALEVLSHQYGCSQLGDDYDNTQKALAAAIKHPNAGGVLVLGLGCENNQVKLLQETLGSWDHDRVKFLIAQDVEDEVEEGFKVAKELVETMKADRRTEVPVSKLKIGLKCGGSDAFSGITANPLLGVFSDWLVSKGGSSILTEVPEMFGAETILMNRAKDNQVFDKTVGLINNFKDYFRASNQVIYENPSPGNKDGGITTLEEKSLGAIQKGGQAQVNDVLDYADQIKVQGLNLLWSPGNDLVASSALGMAGCQIVLFTTGRGTPFGSFVPTMKISTNSTLFNKKKNWIDFNAGELLEDKRMNEVCDGLIGEIIAVANGKKLKHEIANFKEIAIFKSGVTL